MPGTLWYPFRQGDRSEYLAHYILSALGIAVPIPRQEDIGADFYCSLAESKGNRLIFHGPYLVQTKSESVSEIGYGGPDDRERWKKEEVDWLFNQEIPLLIGMVDKVKLTLDLYSTSNMWAARYEGGHCGKVILLPGKTDGRERVPQPNKRRPDLRWPDGIGDGFVWEVPLGLPVVSLSIDESENKERIATRRTVLSEHLHLDQANITYQRLHVHFSRWPHSFTTNLRPTSIGEFYAWNTKEGTNTTEQIAALAPIITALARNYKAQGQKELLRKLKGAFELLPRSEIHESLRNYIPELFS